MKRLAVWAGALALLGAIFLFAAVYFDRATCPISIAEIQPERADHSGARARWRNFSPWAPAMATGSAMAKFPR
jgi:hypothetical protein